MSLVIDIDREPNGDWLASVRDLGGIAVRDRTREGALRSAQVLALRALADQLQREERAPFAAFGVTAVEGPAILAVRERAAQTLRELQQQAENASSATMTDEDIDAEIRAARSARPRATSSTPPKNVTGR
jgi:predicted RNase H-like HicB family nuclease